MKRNYILKEILKEMIEDFKKASTLKKCFQKLKFSVGSSEIQKIESLFHTLSILENDFESGIYMTTQEHEEKRIKLLQEIKIHFKKAILQAKANLNLIEEELNSVDF